LPHKDAIAPGCRASARTPAGCRPRSRSASGRRSRRLGFLGLFFMCCLYSVDVIKSAKGAYLEISSSSKH
jgi:hypothetical protein